MTTKNTIGGIGIIIGITRTAHAVGVNFDKDKLNQLLEIFDQHPSDNDLDYKEPGKLVLWAYRSLYAVCDTETAEYIKVVFPWFKPDIDLSLL